MNDRTSIFRSSTFSLNSHSNYILIVSDVEWKHFLYRAGRLNGASKFSEDFFFLCNFWAKSFRCIVHINFAVQSLYVTKYDSHVIGSSSQNVQSWEGALAIVLFYLLQWFSSQHYDLMSFCVIFAPLDDPFLAKRKLEKKI